MSRRSGGQVVVDSLVAHGVRATFGVPGESYLPVLDALVDTDIRVVTCRHEGGAAFMAEAWSKLTGEPGVCLVTRGPGATNAAIGVHTARQSSTAIVLLVGQVATPFHGREAFQEVDYLQMYGGLAKWTTELRSADDAAEVMVEAFHRAQEGRPGPVVVSLPEDALSGETNRATGAPRPVERSRPNATETVAIAAHLAASQRPVFLVGGGGWTDDDRRALAALAERLEVPVVAGFRRNDLIDNDSRVYAGEAGTAMPAAVRATLTEADCIVGLGVRFGEITTAEWTVWPAPDPGVDLVHVHPEAMEIGKIYEPSVGVVAHPATAIEALAERRLGPFDSGWCRERRRAYLSTLDAPPQPGSLDMGQAVAELQTLLPPDAIVTNGAGNFTVWPNKYLRYGADARLLAPQSGAMGYGLPAAIAAKLAHPDRAVVCFAGDGDLQMTIAELGTALQTGTQPIVLVIDNGMYGTIRMHQERTFPGRVIGTDLRNPDFVALARSYGMHAEQVSHTHELGPAFTRAVDSPTGALLHLLVEPHQLTPAQTVDEARVSHANR